jgi:hypothetical protein
MSASRSASWFRDRAPGAFFVVIGVGAYLIARDYPAGTAFQMGPGYLPAVVSILLILCGAGIIALGGRDLPDGDDESPEWSSPAILVRLMIAILGSYVVFAFALPVLGLAISVFLLVVIAAAARPDIRLPEVLALAVALAVICPVVFINLLGLSARALPPGLFP